jgi:hypothetical protein
MTLLLPAAPNSTNAGMPGAAPLGTSMQGNPSPANTVVQPELNGPQNSAGQLLHTQISAGNIPLNTQPSNVAVVPGGDSLLAQMSRGQVSLNQSSYGQGATAPLAGNTGPALGVAPCVPVQTGQANGVTYPTPGSAVSYTGN